MAEIENARLVNTTLPLERQGAEKCQHYKREQKA